MTYRVAERFYKNKKGSDIRSFFTDKDIVKDFTKYWNSRRNSQRSAIEKKFRSFSDRVSVLSLK